MRRTGQIEMTFGMDRAEERAAAWSGWARDYIWAAWAGATLTADDIRDAIGDPPGSGNAMGAVLHLAAKADLIRAVGWQTSTRPERHRAVLRVWERCS